MMQEAMSAPLAQELIFAPMLVQVLLVLVVWVLVFVMRAFDIRRHDINPQDLAERSQARSLLRSRSADDNFSNLCELPPLFYAAVLCNYLTGTVDAWSLALACVFVLGRVVHSLIHLSYNNIMHRFRVYLLSSAALWGYWVLLGWRIFAHMI